MLIHLAIHPEWMEKCKKEIQDLLSRNLESSLSSATLHEKLAAVPVSAWEDELPVLEACTRESQRIVHNTVALRRCVQKEMKIGEQVVKRGDFLVYSMADVHLNPEYYSEPHKYDPGRWLRPDPVPNAAYPFLGWGAGRHPCTGVKAAKLEMKSILALFLMRYEFDLVDKDGKFPDPLPVPNRNDIHQVRAEPRVRCPRGVHPALSSPACLGPSPRSYVLLQLRKGRRIDRLPHGTFRPSSSAGSDLFRISYRILLPGKGSIVLYDTS